MQREKEQPTLVGGCHSSLGKFLLALCLENLKLSQGIDRIKKKLEDEELKYWEKKYRGTSFHFDKFHKDKCFSKNISRNQGYTLLQIHF